MGYDRYYDIAMEIFYWDIVFTCELYFDIWLLCIEGICYKALSSNLSACYFYIVILTH